YCSSTRLCVESCVVLPYLPVLAEGHNVGRLLHRLRLLLRGRVRTLFWLGLGFYRFGNFDGLGLRFGQFFGLRFGDSRRLVGDNVLCRRLSWQGNRRGAGERDRNRSAPETVASPLIARKSHPRGVPNDQAENRGMENHRRGQRTAPGFARFEDVSARHAWFGSAPSQCLRW